MWMYLWIILPIIGAFIYLNLLKPYKYWKDREVPHEKPYPIVGNLLDFILRRKHLMDIQEHLYYLFPGRRYIGVYQLKQPALLVRDLDLIKQLTVKDFDHFSDHLAFFSKDLDDIMSKTLISLNGQEWKEMRATLSPAFTSAKIKNMFSFILECSENFANYFKNNPEVSGDVPLKEIFSKFTTDVIATTNFGIKCDSLEDPENEFIMTAKEVTSFGTVQAIKVFFMQMLPKLARLFNLKLFSQKTTDFIKRIVLETIAKREAENIYRPDLLHLLNEAKKGRLKHETKNEITETGFATVEESDLGKKEAYQKKQLSDTDITAQALLFFLAGFDTTSTVTSFMAYELAVNREVQEKLQEEIDAVLDNLKGEKLGYEALMQMKYLDQVLSETLRKWPPAFQTDRLCVKDYTIEPATANEKPLVVEKGGMLMFPILAIQRNPKYFPEPLKFDPERFNEENKKRIVPGSYFPFGVGPRNCIGSRFALLVVKLLFFTLLKNFDIEPTKSTPIPYKPNPQDFHLIPKTMTLAFKPRKITSL